MESGMPQRLVFIINPISGKKLKGGERRRRVEAFLEREGVEATIVESEYAGHACELAQSAIKNGARRLICIGGDGTINEVGRAVVRTDCEFALVPMGSGNGLARHLGIPLNFEAALKLAVSGNAVAIDTGEAGGRPFFNVMGIGFDAEVSRLFNETNARGLISYVRESWKAYRTFRSSTFSVESATDKQSLDVYILAVANSSQYGNNVYIAPDASITDGKLDLVVISNPTFVAFFVIVWRMLRKKIYSSPRVTSICSESFILKSDDGGHYHVDGEVFPRGPEMTVKVCPKSLNIVVGHC